MDDLPPTPSGATRRGGRANVGAPRWVKVFGGVALVLAVVWLLLHLGGHGLGEHGR